MRPTSSSLCARAALVACCVTALVACTSAERRADAATGASSTVVADELSEAEVAGSADATPAAPAPATAALASALPRLASGSAPVYPRMSRRIGEEGWVEVAIDVRQDGEVVALAMVGSSGSERLEDAAMTAVRTWRFHPRTGPRGVDRLAHRIVFRLERDAAPR